MNSNISWLADSGFGRNAGAEVNYSTDQHGCHTPVQRGRAVPEHNDPNDALKGNPGTGTKADTGADTATDQKPVSYIHFVTFLGLRGIETLSSDDIDPDQTESRHGASMEVLRGRVLHGNRQGQLVALKQARRSSETAAASHGQGGRRSPERKPRAWILDLYFEMQIMTHRSLRNHPNIVQLIGIVFNTEPKAERSRWPFTPSLVVEPADCNLAEFFRHRLPDQGPLSFRDTFSLIADVADGLSVLHAHRVIHSDVKPENILVFSNENAPESSVTAKICDFGSASIAGEPDAERQHKLLWTPGWEAPERDLGGDPEPTKEQDIYSFGLVAAYIALNGTRRDVGELVDRAVVPATNTASSHTARLEAAISEYHVRHQNDIPDLSVTAVRDLEGLLSTCLQPRPDSRIKKLADVRATLRADDEERPGPRSKLVVPLQKSICRFNRETVYDDITVKMVYVGMKKAYPGLPRWLKDRVIDEVRATLHPDLGQHTATHDSGPAAAGSALFALHQLDFASRLPLHPQYGDLSRGENHHRYMREVAGRPTGLPEGLTGQEGLIKVKQSSDAFPGLGRVPQMTLEEGQQFAARLADGVSALHVAVHLNRPELIETLVRFTGTADPVIRDRGWSPLHEAAAWVRYGCARELIRLGADVNLATKQSTPLSVLLREGQTNAAAEPDMEPDFLSFLQLLLDNGADPWASNAPGFHEPATHINNYTHLSPRVMRILLAHDPNLADAPNASLETPIMRSAINGDEDLVTMLLDHHADVDAADFVGYTALHKLWNNVVPLGDIQRRYWPGQDLRPPSMVTRQTRTPIPRLKRIIRLLIDRGASQGPSTGASTDTPSLAGFNNLQNLIGPHKVTQYGSPLDCCVALLLCTPCPPVLDALVCGKAPAH
jgi:serine/threonine protein kinase/ankyrin repeat protein